MRAGHPRARLRATRDGLTAIRLHLGAAAVETGLLDALAERGRHHGRLAARLGAVDEELLVAFLRVAASVGLLERGRGPALAPHGPRPGDRGRRPGAGELRGLLRAAHAPSTGEMASMLTGGERRRRLAEHGALIARHLPGLRAAGHGRADPGGHRASSPPRARHRVRRRSRAGRDARGGARRPTASGSTSTPTPPTWPSGRCASAACPAAPPSSGPTSASPRRGRRGRCPSRSISRCSPTSSTTCRWPNGFRCSATSRACWRPGGLLFLVSTVATPQFFSRHFDLLLRSQEGQMEITDADDARRTAGGGGLPRGPDRDRSRPVHRP